MVLNLVSCNYNSVQHTQTVGQTELAHTLIKATNMALAASYDVTRHHLGPIHTRRQTTVK